MERHVTASIRSYHRAFKASGCKVTVAADHIAALLSNCAATVAMSLGTVTWSTVQREALDFFLDVVLAAEADRTFCNALAEETGVGSLYLHAIASQIANGDAEGPRDLAEAALTVAASFAALPCANSLSKAQLVRPRSTADAEKPGQGLSEVSSLAVSIICAATRRQWSEAALQQACRYVGNVAYGMDDAVVTSAKRDLAPCVIPQLVAIVNGSRLDGDSALRTVTTQLRTLRWASHALSNLVYGRAPNAEQRFALQCNALDALIGALEATTALNCSAPTGEDGAKEQPSAAAPADHTDVVVTRLQHDGVHQLSTLKTLTLSTVLEACANTVFRFDEYSDAVHARLAHGAFQALTSVSAPNSCSTPASSVLLARSALFALVAVRPAASAVLVQAEAMTRSCLPVFIREDKRCAAMLRKLSSSAEQPRVQ